MPVLKCDQCGRFTSHLYDVWCNPPQNGIEYSACIQCYQKLFPSAMSDCVFCRIVAGDEPATFHSDGAHSIAITPLNPVTDGHVLVIPKEHVTDAYESPHVTARTMFDASLWASLFADRDERYVSANIITSVGRPATQSVFHLHLHIVPRRENDGLALPWYSGKRKKVASDE